MPKLYSTKNILTYVNDDVDQCKELLQLFVDTIPPEMELLNQAILDENWNKAFEISHRIKPAITITLAENINENYINLHDNLLKIKDQKDLLSQFTNIQQEVNQAIADISTDLKNKLI